MARRVNKRPLNQWIDENKPSGLAKLALQSGVSTGTLDKVRAGYVPPREGTRQRISRALGISENELFPARDGKEKAS